MTYLSAVAMPGPGRVARVQNHPSLKGEAIAVSSLKHVSKPSQGFIGESKLRSVYLSKQYTTRLEYIIQAKDWLSR